jgi:muramoyltetrapeptide carboxypeptidase LdcA involved in peptidoglycan recycling
MERGSKVAIVCCSDGQPLSQEHRINKLIEVLKQIGLEPVCSEYMYERFSVFGGTGEERAAALMNFYKNPDIKAIYDVSGGNIANEILPYLDFEVIANSKKEFWGYSDLTTLINAIYAKTGRSSVLYQIRNLIGREADNQLQSFTRSVFEKGADLFDFSYDFIQGQEMEGTVVGGNIRCLLKLAGTPYWPDMPDKLLLLEAFTGTTAQMTTYICQLKQMGVFDKLRGIILGTFTKMEEEGRKPSVIDLIKKYAGTEIPIVKTGEIGHGANSKAIIIGKEISLRLNP